MIDEIQDYTNNWLEIITKYFLEIDGEFVCPAKPILKLK